MKRALDDADAALDRLGAQVAQLLAHGPPRCRRVPRARRPGGDRAVLYVDDHAVDDHYGDALRAALPRCDLRVVSDAEEALRLARTRTWGVAVLDLDLGHPTITGLDVLSAIAPSTRVVLISGVSPESLPEIARRARVDAHLAKPFTLDALTKTVAPLLQADRGASARSALP